MKSKLKYSIYLMIVLCSVVPVCIWIVFSVHESERKMEDIISNNIEAIGGSQEMSIQNFCESRKESMETISRMTLVKRAILNYASEGHDAALDEFLKNNQKLKTYIAGIAVVDANFNIIASSQRYVGDSAGSFQELGPEYHEGHFVIGNVYERETEEGVKRLLPASVGIYHEGKLIGYLFEEIICDYFDRLRLKTDFLEAGTLYLIDGRNQIITAGTATETESRQEMVTTLEERGEYYAAREEFIQAGQSEGIINYSYAGQKYITYFSRIEYTDWSICITENMSAQWKSNQSVYLLVMMEGIAVVAILICVQMLITKKLVDPFNQIDGMMKEVQENHDYSLRTNVAGKDEVGVIAHGINELLSYVEKEEREEKRKHREYAAKAEAEAEVLQHRQFLSAAMLENMPSGYHRCLPDAEKGFPFLQLGNHFEEILGWTAEEIKTELGNCYVNLIWPEDVGIAEVYENMVNKPGSGNVYNTSVYRMKHKDGGYRWITDATMFADLGKESFFQGVIADITQYVEGMEEAKKLAEASSHAKTDFLSQMSHDIRTPMNAVIGFTDLMKKSDDLELIRQEYIPKIETASNHLLMIINDVLEMNSIEMGKMTFHRTPQNILKLIEDIVAVMQLQTGEKGLKLICDVQVTDQWCYCDENRFKRVFMNLMSNAIKFTPEGGSITVSLKQQETTDDGYAVYQSEVSDTGIGMSEEFIPLVFDSFERERTSTVSGVEGTGLGMAIVKNIVNAAGGTISVKSIKDGGTTFTVRVKHKLVEPELLSQMETTQKEKTSKKISPESMHELFAGKRVLLVEDNDFNRDIAEAILSGAGFQVEMAEDGHIAVQMVREAPSEDYYDIILMDIQMPTMNGYEATRAIRALAGLRSKVKIIAVTANAFETDKTLARSAGMNGHVSKPIDLNKLYTTLLEVMENDSRA